MALLKLIKNSDNDKLKTILQSDYDPNERDKKTHKTLIHQCIDYSNYEILEILLNPSDRSKTPNLSLKDKNGDVS